MTTIWLFVRSAGVWKYVRHSHTWQRAVTDPSVTPSYLLGLYDVDTLANSDQMPIVLEMTCLVNSSDSY